MKVHYYPDTDTLYIDLNAGASVESEEVAVDLVLDYDASQRLSGIEIEHASRYVDLTTLEVAGLALSQSSKSALHHRKKPRPLRST